MMQVQIYDELAQVARRYRRLWLSTAQGLTWLVCAVAGGVVLWLYWTAGWYFAWAPAALITAALGMALVCSWMVTRSRRSYHWVAREIERRHPQLQARLLAAIEQQPAADGQFGFLQRAVMRQALAHSHSGTWRQTVPTRRLLVAQAGNLAALLLLAVVVVGLLLSAGPERESVERPVVSVVSAGYGVEIDPGDTTVERGSSLLVLARFRNDLPASASLVVQEDSQEEKRLSMSKSLDDPLFGGRIASVIEDLSYHVEFDRLRTPTYRVTVFEYPQLVRADAKLVFPKYTSLEDASIVDTRRISAVEGSELTLIFNLNKPVASAELIEKEGPTIQLAADDQLALDNGTEGTVYSLTFPLKKSSRYRLHLTDEEGRKNQQPPEFVINVVSNRRPTLKFELPARDVRVSPLEELAVKASAWDDFGLNNCGITYSLAQESPQELALGATVPSSQRRALEHVVDLEALAAQPDQLLSYYLWAEDTGPDGELRRTFSDMYFAEVRHFEEIYRQGNQPPGGSQGASGQQGGEGNGRQAEQLAELQKQILNGTWKLIRQEVTESQRVEFLDDTKLLQESQQSALEQAGSLEERLEDPQSKSHLEAVKKHMGEALEKLTLAVEDPGAETLLPAIGPEQAAYEALLKLRAREFSVVRGRRQQGGGSSRGGGNRSERQLQELELTNSRNRYETERTSSPQENPAQREVRQVLNRLRELARRQADLAERLKELQSALAEARSQDERDEIERQLKRLRDEEQRILRDTDELRQRMDRPENQEQMAEAGQELDQTRSNVRRASEALEQGLLSQAASEGTRAARSFEELRDEFRKRAANRFEEEMKEMRAEARELDEDEQGLGKRLAEIESPKQRTLRDTGERQEIVEGFERQKEGLEELLRRMQETVKEAEEPEPLLSEKLYDAIRETKHRRLEESLDLTKQLLERGFIGEASRTETQVGQSVRKLREDVEKAAESVLGDGTDALRRAQQELKELADQVNREIARADAEGQNANGEGAPSERPSQESQPQDGQARGERRRGEGTAQGGQRRQGEAEGERSQSEQVSQSDQPQDGQGTRGEGQSQGGRQSQGGQPGGERSGDSRRAALSQGREAESGRAGDAGRRPRSAGLRRQGGGSGPGGLEEYLGGDGRRPVAPIAGDDFREWSDRLRDVEETIDDAELRAEAARIRDRARGIRQDVKRHSREPNWELVRLSVAEPLAELELRIGEELLRRQSRDALVPIDRDPVPSEYTEQVRRYYERLGSGE